MTNQRPRAERPSVSLSPIENSSTAKAHALPDVAARLAAVAPAHEALAQVDPVSAERGS